MSRDIDFDEVYAIRHPDGFWKVGKSGNARHRLRGMQSGSPYKLTLEYAIWYMAFDPVMHENADIESAVHERLAHSNVRGEWFDVSREDVRTAFATIVTEYEQAHSWGRYDAIESLSYRERTQKAHDFWMEVTAE